VCVAYIDRSTQTFFHVCCTARIDLCTQTFFHDYCTARIDLSGGWTDTPPIAYEHGGAVVNVAIQLNGKVHMVQQG